MTYFLSIFLLLFFTFSSFTSPASLPTDKETPFSTYLFISGRAGLATGMSVKALAAFAMGINKLARNQLSKNNAQYINSIFEPFYSADIHWLSTKILVLSCAVCVASSLLSLRDSHSITKKISLPQFNTNSFFTYTVIAVPLVGLSAALIMALTKLT